VTDWNREWLVAARIEVDKVKEGEFKVRVIEATSESTHRVTLKEDDYRRLSGGKIEPNELIRRSFEFLLERESKESILPQFDLPLIGRYFPEYERELKRKI
jgi:hypothetical protein